MSKVTFIYCLILSIGLLSCRKKPLPPSAQPSVEKPVDSSVIDSGLSIGTLYIKLSNVVGNKPLIVDNATNYVLNNGDTFTVSTFNYYLSNFIFTDEKGKQFVEPASYHLAISESPETLNFSIDNVPYGKYKSVSFLIGVDSVRNFSGIQTGALDPKYGMIWSWSTGYIMAKMEGKSPQSSLPSKQLSYHIAGFKGIFNVIQSIELNFPQPAIVAKSKNPTLHFNADLQTWFQSPNFTSFNIIPEVSLEGQKAYSISLNYRSMLRITSVENP